MKTFVRHAVMLMAVAATCQAGLALADELRWISGDSQATTLVSDEKVAAKDQSACADCSESLCGQCGECGAGAVAVGGCDDSPQRGIVGVFGFDSFKGVSDSDYLSNFGAVTGLNAAMPVPGLRDYGVGWQLGMTYGVYDIDGTTNDSAQSQQQTFVTTGFYRKGGDDQRLSFGIVYDWMLNKNWGDHGHAPTLGQWRAQVEYALSDVNGVGIYGSQRDLGSVQYCVLRHLVTDRAVNQVNMFWHHKFDSAADSWLWVGLPDRRRISQHGSLGDWIVGANIQVPISERLALYGNAQYMHPSAVAGPAAAIEADWNIGAGIMWYFGGNAVSNSLNGKCWLPYMPVANNSTFLVDEYSPNYNP